MLMICAFGRPAKERPVVVEPELVRGALAVLVGLERLAVLVDLIVPAEDEEALRER